MIIAVVGSGGKTTICETLGRTLARMGQKVLLTTTTHMYPPPGVPLTVGGSGFLPAPAGLSAAAKETGPGGKLIGFSGEEIDALDSKGLFKAIIAEADGARGRPLKAPEEWEPVYPQKTGLVIGVIGLAGLGRPAAEETVHRSALFKKITGAKSREPVTWDHLLELVRHPEGLFRHTPEGAIRTVFLNQADTFTHPESKALAFEMKAGIPVFLTSRDKNWADAFIKSYILREGV